MYMNLLLLILESKNSSTISDENLASKLRYTVRVKHTVDFEDKKECNISQ